MAVTLEAEEAQCVMNALKISLDFTNECIPFLQKVAISSPLAAGIYSEEAARLLKIAGEPLITFDCPVGD
jgi:hypothetical protein